MSSTSLTGMPAVAAWVLLILITAFNAQTLSTLTSYHHRLILKPGPPRHYSLYLPQALPLPSVPAALNISNLGVELSDDDGWTNTSPDHNGTVRIDPSLYTSSQWQDPLAHAVNPNAKSFTLTMYHQVHCLDTLRSAYTLLQTTPPSESASEAEVARHSEVMKLANHAYAQAPYCLDVVRQALLCRADTTLEPSMPIKHADGSWAMGVKGINTIHRCNNWEAIRSWVETNQKAWRTSVLSSI